MSGSNLMYELSEGNPGALNVVSHLDYRELAILVRTQLRGSMIWVGYKDICKEDIETFKEKIDNGSIESLVKETPDWDFFVKNRTLR